MSLEPIINIRCNIKDNFVMLGGGKEEQSVILNENVLSLVRQYLTVRENEKKYMVRFLHQLN